MIESQRSHFDLPDDVSFLSAASYSPLPKAVQDAGRDGVGRKAQPWLYGRPFRDQQNERARAAAARLLNAAPDDVALIPSVSYGFATAAKLLPIPQGATILVLEDDHASPVLEWQTRAAEGAFRVAQVSRPSDGDWTAAVLDAVADKRNRPLALASISSVHWADGAVLDLAQIASALRAAGAHLAVDATQAAGVIPLDVSEVDPDFVVFPTYKWLLGPYGRAFLYIAPRHQAGMPLEQTASGRRRITSDATIYLQDTDHVADARRFDMGQRDYFVTMEMASVGIEYVSHLGASEIAAYTKRLTDQAAEALPERLIPKTASRAPHILSLQVEPDRAKDIETTLASDQIFVSARLGRLRLSPHVYNEPRDIERFVSKLRPLLN
ncbi:MAG: aminotransferase class V-fold PLP-dependent enzyme [Pseudomonadota bacterium]